MNAELGTLSFLDTTFGSDTISVVTTDIRGASGSKTIAVGVNAPVVTTAPGAASARPNSPFRSAGSAWPTPARCGEAVICFGAGDTTLVGNRPRDWSGATQLKMPAP